MKTVEISPYDDEPPIRAIPKNEKKGVIRGVSRPMGRLLQVEAGANISGSQEAKKTRVLSL